MLNSKKLLRFKQACSSIEEFSENQIFQRVIGEVAHDLNSPSEIKKVVMCSGQFFYDILDLRDKLGRKDIAIVRIEQLAPFPFTQLQQKIGEYTNAEFIWCQEEHQNYGAWSFVQERIENLLRHMKQEGLVKNTDLSYVGRAISPVTATGSSKIHQIEHKKILEELFES